MVVRIAVYCTDAITPVLQQGIKQFAEKQDLLVEDFFFQNPHEYIEALEENSLWDFLVVAAPGARGMETVISTRELAPKIPLLWCSDDAEFAVTSYRLHCDLFLPMPLQASDMEDALHRCLM